MRAVGRPVVGAGKNVAVNAIDLEEIDLIPWAGASGILRRADGPEPAGCTLAGAGEQFHPCFEITGGVEIKAFEGRVAHTHRLYCPIGIGTSGQVRINGIVKPCIPVFSKSVCRVVGKIPMAGSVAVIPGGASVPMVWI